MIVDRPLAEQAKNSPNVPHISSPIDRAPVHVACIDAPCVQFRLLLSVICIRSCITSQSMRKSLAINWMCVLLHRDLELCRGLFVIPFENLQLMIFRLYLLIPLEQGLLEQLILSLCSFCASSCSVGLGTEGGKFLFQE